MPHIYETATLTSKGQITLPKPIRQALGVAAGSKLVFDLKDGVVVVSRLESDAEHQDPAITHFLNLLERDISKGQNIQTLPQDLLEAMQKYRSQQAIDLTEDIDGDVVL